MASANRTILVTGASTGIGYDAALRMARRGFVVYAGARREVDLLALAAQHANIRPIRLDVTSSEDIAAAVQRVTQDTGGKLYGLVNNAGIVKAGPVEFLPLEEWRAQMEVNLIGQIAVTQAFLPLIRAAKGRILYVSSVSGEMSAPLTGAYSASKFALEGMLGSLRLELDSWKIQVISIRPGQISTPIWHKSLKTSSEIEAKMPPAAFELYGKSVNRLKQIVQAAPDKATPVSKVSDAIERALTASTPRFYYRVGNDAHVGGLLNWLLPARWMFKLILRFARKAV
jgi:NAD(P)-dependent dehydrogenase (short-subunit alcohol dehydrogenase family)